MAPSGCPSSARLAVLISGFIFLISGADSFGRPAGHLRKLLQSDGGNKAPTLTKIVYEDVDQGSAASGTHGDPAGASYRAVRQLRSGSDGGRQAEVYEGGPLSPAPAPKYQKQRSDGSGRDGGKERPDGTYEPKPQSTADEEVYEAGPVPPAYAPKYEDVLEGKSKPVAQQSAAEVYEGAPAPAPRIEKQSSDETYEAKAQQSAGNEEVYEAGPISPARAPAPGKGLY